MPDPLDPTKYHVITETQKKYLSIVAIIFVVVILPIVSNMYYNLALTRPAQSGKEVELKVDRGQGVMEISSALFDAGAINSEFLFNFYVYTSGQSKNMQAGTYKIPAGSSLKEVVEQFQHGTNDVRLTFLEGWRVEEYGILAAQSLENLDYEKFIQLAKKYEGQLFPDTYYIPKGIQEDELIDMLNKNFNDKTADLLTDKNLNKIGFTKEQVLILASLVEREVRDPEDKAIVAGILIKRLNDGMKLDVDATTQFATANNQSCVFSPDDCTPKLDDAVNVNWWPTSLTVANLDLNDPYNTRKNVGLPPAPISNPGLDSINAVINYKESPYYFYLTDSDGVTHFSKTLEEHNAAAEKYISH